MERHRRRRAVPGRVASGGSSLAAAPLASICRQNTANENGAKQDDMVSGSVRTRTDDDVVWLMRRRGKAG